MSSPNLSEVEDADFNQEGAQQEAEPPIEDQEPQLQDPDFNRGAQHLLDSTQEFHSFEEEKLEPEAEA